MVPLECIADNKELYDMHRDLFYPEMVTKAAEAVIISPDASCTALRNFDAQGLTGLLFSIAKSDYRRGGEDGMKKELSTKILAKEATLWDRLKKTTPGKVCRK